MGFYCKIGNIETTTPWHKPTVESLQSWYDQWSLLNADKFEVYCVGNAAEKFWGNSTLNTWDCDIVLSGKIHNYNELRNLLEQAVQIGFENKILIDAWYNDKLLSFNSFKPMKQIRAFKTFYKEVNEEVFEHTFQGVKEVHDGLYQTDIIQPTKSCKKAYKRFQEGKYSGIQKDLKNTF